MAGLRLERFAYVSVAGDAKFALLELKDGFIIACVRVVAHRALAAFERRVRYLLLEKVTLIGMAYQAKIRDRCGNGEGSLRLAVDVTSAATHHHPGMNRIANDLGLRRPVRSVASRAGGVRHRVTAVRFRNIRRRQVMALLT